MSIATVLIFIVNLLQLIIQVYKLLKNWQREIQFHARQEMARRRRQERQAYIDNDMQFESDPEH